MSERSDELELTALEAALRDLRPQADMIDRPTLMFRAGRASARGWGWPLTALGAASLAGALGILQLIRPAPPVVERIVYVSVPTPQRELSPPKPEESVAPAPPETIAAESPDWDPRSRYLPLQEQVLRRGLDGLPPPPPVSALEGPPTIEQLLQSP